MDPTKVQAVLDWAQPATLKQVQRFLGFANFYCRFIRNLSLVAPPLTALTKGAPARIKWTAEAQRVLDASKVRNTGGPPD